MRRHRRVDVLTDSHPVHGELRARFPGANRRYASIVLDVLFDHFLCLEWSRYATGSRDQFIDHTYRIITDHPDLLPRPFADVAPRWVASDWLRVYDSLEGVGAVLARLSRRLSEPAGLLAAWDVASRDTGPLRSGFLRLFPEVRTALDGLHCNGA